MIDETLNFSLWLDFIERNFIENEFIELVEGRVINGATSNPSIFATSITSSSAYKEQLESLKGKTPKEKYEALAIYDIKRAAIALRGDYDEGLDGYVSIEIDPFLANDIDGSIKEGRRLFKAIDEPNVMIKVPATKAGYEVMRVLLSDGISVNATLVFSPQQARECLSAMKRGIDEFENSGGRRIEAVISVFVSRFDRLLDRELEKKGLATSLTGIMNAGNIYNLVQANKTPSIKTLFASTSVKSDKLPKDYYIRELYGSHLVNTAPLETIEAFRAGNKPTPKLPIPQDRIDEYFNTLAKEGINMQEVYERLMREGVEAFKDAFKNLLKELEE